MKNLHTNIASTSFRDRCFEDADFGIALDHSNSLDRILQIVVIDDPIETHSNTEDCSTSADWASHNKRREGIKNENGDGSAVVKVTTLRISSHILAAKSPFFNKLFSNGMRESGQRHVTVRITSSEEAPLMELLDFMYNGTLSVTSPTALLDVLMAADKFEVASCTTYCSRVLQNIPMTPECALLYLELPSSVLMADAVQPLIDAAKQYLAGRYKDVTKHQEELMDMPLAGVKAILTGDELQVASEDAVHDFVLKWVRAQYPKLEEMGEFLEAKLARFIRFAHIQG